MLGMVERLRTDQVVLQRIDDILALRLLEERAELTYTDTIGMIITVVDYLINAITISLIIFVSLALVVSCFMIAVITFISTMERRT